MPLAPPSCQTAQQPQQKLVTALDLCNSDNAYTDVATMQGLRLLYNLSVLQDSGYSMCMHRQ